MGHEGSGSGVDRREFLRRAGRVAGAAAATPLLGALPGLATRAVAGVADRSAKAGPESVLDRPASEAPFDTVVVVMMENRSFDHLLGWTGTDGDYLEAGRRRYGARFAIDGKQDLTYRNPQGEEVATYWLPGVAGQQYPYQGCGDGIPGHGWYAGRAQRDRGFLGRGSGNNDFALGYYRASDMGLFDQMVRRFTTGDRWFSSLLGPTFPNRQYLYAAQSGGARGDPGPLKPGTFTTPTIWDNLLRAKASVGYYHTDLPILALWGRRFFPYVHSLASYFEDAAAGKLANLVMIDPGFQIAQRTDDHPVGDIRTGQRWIRAIFQAFAESPHWQRGVFVLVYDEWGGFFDHVNPPVVADNRRTKQDSTNFGQLGFRVPAIVASPFVRPGYADHTRYDHTSILRLLEWRFLGAPATGPAAGKRAQWWLTDRDRNANNLAGTLSTTPQVDVGFDLAIDLPPGADPCTFGALGGASKGDPFFDVTNAMADLQDTRFKAASEKLWN